MCFSRAKIPKPRQAEAWDKLIVKFDKKQNRNDSALPKAGLAQRALSGHWPPKDKRKQRN
jgi:hypothetical protein